MRKLGIALLVIVVLLVAAALIVPHVIDINSYHAQIQSQLEKKLGRQVSLGPMSLSLFPPSFQVSNAVIGEDKNFNTARAFATADRLAVSIKLLPLLRKEVGILPPLASKASPPRLRGQQRIRRLLLKPPIHSRLRRKTKPSSPPKNLSLLTCASAMARWQLPICKNISHALFMIILTWT